MSYKEPSKDPTTCPHPMKKGNMGTMNRQRRALTPMYLGRSTVGAAASLLTATPADVKKSVEFKTSSMMAFLLIYLTTSSIDAIMSNSRFAIDRELENVEFVS